MSNCSCGSDATSLNPAEVVVHREDGPCYIATAVEAERPDPSLFIGGNVPPVVCA